MEELILEELRKINKKLEQHDKRFDEYDKQFNAINNKLSEHDEQFKSHDQHFALIEETLKEHTRMLSGLKTAQEETTAKIDGLNVQNAKEFGEVKEQMEDLSINFELLKDDTWKNKHDIHRIQTTMGMK